MDAAKKSQKAEKMASAQRASINKIILRGVENKVLAKDVADVLCKPLRQAPTEIAEKIADYKIEMKRQQMSLGSISISRRYIPLLQFICTKKQNIKNNLFYSTNRTSVLRNHRRLGHVLTDEDESPEDSISKVFNSSVQGPDNLKRGLSEIEEDQNRKIIQTKSGVSYDMDISSMVHWNSSARARHRWKFAQSFVQRLVRATLIFKLQPKRHYVVQNADDNDMQTRGLTYLLKSHQTKADMVFSSKVLPEISILFFASIDNIFLFFWL